MNFRNIASIACLAAIAGAATAGTVTVRYTPFQTGIGGEFRIERGIGFSGVVDRASDVSGIVTANNVADNGKTLTNLSGDFYNNFSKGSTLTQRSASTTNRALRDFQTFCIERTEHVNNNTVYNFSIDAGAIAGGLSGGTGAIKNTTAWLYTAFRSNTLPGYNMWGVAEADRESSAKTLQHVIWYFEGELTSWTHNPNGLTTGANSQFTQAQLWRDAAIAATTGLNPWVNTNVRALNLFTDNNSNGVYDAGIDVLAQSQLTIIPLPTAGGLGMAGLLTVLCVRRRVRI